MKSRVLFGITPRRHYHDSSPQSTTGQCNITPRVPRNHGKLRTPSARKQCERTTIVMDAIVRQRMRVIAAMSPSTKTAVTPAAMAPTAAMLRCKIFVAKATWSAVVSPCLYCAGRTWAISAAVEVWKRKRDGVRGLRCSNYIKAWRSVH